MRQIVTLIIVDGSPLLDRLRGEQWALIRSALFHAVEKLEAEQIQVGSRARVHPQRWDRGSLPLSQRAGHRYHLHA